MERLFDAVWGQGRAVELLSKNIAGNMVASAYLFTGASGMGKCKTALIFARALLCEKPAEPDCRCKSCRLFLSGNHPDFMGVIPTEAKSKNPNFAELVRKPKDIGNSPKGRMIKIDQIKELITAFSMKPYLGGRRVCVLEGVSHMNNQTANAFLKTLEEPPPESVLILLTDSRAALLPTIVSRCREVRFTPMEPYKLAGKLVEFKGLSESEALQLAELSGGRAEAALGDEMEHVREVDEEALEILSRIMEMKPEEVVARAESWREKREDIPLLFQRMMEVLRLSIGPHTVPPSGTMALALEQLGQLPPDRLLDGYYELMELVPILAFNPNIQLLLESTIFNLQSIFTKGVSLAE